MFMVVGCGPKAVNQDCSSDSDCETNICHAGICASPQPVELGNACTGNGECKSYNCQGGKCVDGVTAKDAVCRDNTECKSKNCEAGKCGLNVEGLACGGDNECKDNICYEKKCAKKCTKQDDCGAKQDCGSDDGKRAFCYDRKYATDTGKACGAEGSTCPGRFRRRRWGHCSTASKATTRSPFVIVLSSRPCMEPGCGCRKRPL